MNGIGQINEANQIFVIDVTQALEYIERIALTWVHDTEMNHLDYDDMIKEWRSEDFYPWESLLKSIFTGDDFRSICSLVEAFLLGEKVNKEIDIAEVTEKLIAICLNKLSMFVENLLDIERVDFLRLSLSSLDASVWVCIKKTQKKS